MADTTARPTVRTRSGVTHYGNAAGRYQVETACGSRSKLPVGTVVAPGTPITCKSCAAK